jgi:hypothetical protein
MEDIDSKRCVCNRRMCGNELEMPFHYRIWMMVYAYGGRGFEALSLLYMETMRSKGEFLVAGGRASARGSQMHTYEHE